MTRQEKLEWLARNVHEWPDHAVCATTDGKVTSHSFSFANIVGDNAWITRKEWLSMREKLQNKPELDNSWHERGELPPVGCKCEILGAFGLYTEWFECEIIASHLDSVFAANERSWINVKKGERQFRPLRTEREKAIDEMIDIICAGGYFTRRDGAAREIAERIFDAGYRKEQTK